MQDPQVKLREECQQKKECQAFQNKLQECNDRVNSRKKTEETCVEELFDFVHCVDHCVRFILVFQVLQIEQLDSFYWPSYNVSSTMQITTNCIRNVNWCHCLIQCISI